MYQTPNFEQFMKWRENMKKLTMNELASKIAKREGKKHQASIGDIREILKIIGALEYEDAIFNREDDSRSPICCLIKYANEIYTPPTKMRVKAKRK